MNIVSWSLKAQEDDPTTCDTRTLVETWHHPDEYMEHAIKLVNDALGGVQFTVYTNDVVFLTVLRAQIRAVGLKGTVLRYYQSGTYLEQVGIDSDGRFMDAFSPLESHFDLIGKALRELI